MNGHIVGKVLIFIRSSIKFRLELKKKRTYTASSYIKYPCFRGKTECKILINLYQLKCFIALSK